MQLGHLQFHRQDVKMRGQEVHAISSLTAAHLQMHRLLLQELTSCSGYDKLQWLSEASVAVTSFSGCHKLQWLSEASVANTINTLLPDRTSDRSKAPKQKQLELLS